MMKRTKKTLSCLLLSVLPATAFADITFFNHTSAEVVTVSYRHLCSSLVDGGAIQPKGNYTLLQMYIDNNCYKECLVDVFASPSCDESKKIAKAKISGKEGGVIPSSITVLNAKYVVTGSGSSASIREADGGNGWFSGLFG